jgi:predicted DNA-binding transcriptional regulator AlpA
VSAGIVRIGIREVVQRTGLSPVSVWRWTRDGRFPPPEYLGERRLWRVDVLERWEAERLARPRTARRGARNLNGEQPQVAP